MNESQARQLAAIYESMGYQANYEQTGGGVHLVYVFSNVNNSMTVFGNDTISKFVDGEMVTGIAL